MVVVPLAPTPAAALQTPSTSLTLTVDTGHSPDSTSLNEDDDPPNDPLANDPTKVTVTATLDDDPLAVPVELTLGVIPSLSSATSGLDFFSIQDLNDSTVDITIAAGSLSDSVEINIDPKQDRFTEGPETIVIGALYSANTGITTLNPATVTIIDDDMPSTAIDLSVNTPSLAEAGGPKTVRVTARVDDGAPTTDVTVTLSLSGTAVSGTDADYTTGTLPTITIGMNEIEGSAVIVITPVNDRLIETNETITVDGATNAAGFNTVTSADITLTSEDMASDEITLSVDTPSLAETASSTNITVTAEVNDGARTSAVTVTLSLSGTALSGTDYADPGTLADITIPANETEGSAVIAINPTNDRLIETNETITVDGATNAAGFNTVTSADITLTSEDMASDEITLSVDTPSLAETASSTNITVTAEVNDGARTTAVTVTLSLSGTALSGTDYADPGTLADITIPANETEGSAVIAINPTNDRLIETNETITVDGATNAAGFNTVTSADITLTSEDIASTAIELSVDTPSLAETASSTNITVTAKVNNGAPTTAVTVTLSLSGTALSGTDYADPGTLADITIPANETEGSAVIAINPTNDRLIETNETITVGGDATGGLDLEATAVDITLTSEDIASTAIELSVNTPSLAETASSTNITVTAKVNNGAPTTAVTVTLSLSGTALSGTDYADPGTLADITIPANETEGSAVIAITPVNDRLIETNETITVDGATNAAGFNTVTSADITLTSEDMASDEITLSVDTPSLAETASSTNITVTAEVNDGARTSAVTVTLSLSGTALSGTDYADPGTLADITIPANETEGSAVIAINPTNDRLIETNETITVDGATNAAGFNTVTSADITLTSEDMASDEITLSVDTPSLAETASSTNITVTAEVNDGARTTAVTVTLSLSGTALSGTDYADPGTLADITIPANETEGSAVIAINPTNDRLIETNETITVDGATNAAGFNTVTSADITLTSEDIASTAIELSVDTPSLAETASSTNITVTAKVNNGAPTTAVTVTLSLSGTALSGTDYADPGTLADITIPANETEGSAVIAINPTNDRLIETNETITVGGDATGGLDLEATAVDITLTSEDIASTAIELSVNTPSLAETASSTNITVTAKVNNGAPTTAVTVTLSLSGTALSGTDYADPGTLADITIPANETEGSAVIAINPTNDRLIETNETITVDGATNAAGFNTVTSADITLTSEDMASDEITLSVDTPSLAETASSTNITVTAEVNDGARTSAVTVTLSLSGTALSGTDYADPGTLADITIPANETEGSAVIAINPTNDRLIETNETITVDGATNAAGFNTVTSADITLTSEDMASDEITLSVDTPSLAETASSTNITVTAEVNDGARTTAVTVTLSLSGTALSGTDYADPGTLADITIPANETEGSAVIAINPTNDRLIETNETITVDGATNAAGFNTVTSADITLTSEDIASTAIELSVDTPSLAETASSTNITVTAKVNNGAPTTAVTVTLSLSGTALSGTDYADPGTLADITIPANETEGSAVIAINPTNDRLIETNETITVGGDATGGLDLEATAVDITLTSEDIASTAIELSVNTPSLAETASSTNITVTAKVNNGAPTTAVTVTLSLSGTALSGTDADYTTGTLPTITIGMNEIEGSADIVITPVNDRLIETDETITVGGTATGGLTVGVTPADITLTSEDTESTAIDLSVDTSSLAEAGGPKTVRVTARVDDGAPAADVTVTLSLSGTAVSGIDADYITGTLPTITIGMNEIEGSADIVITPVNDRLIESDKTITVEGDATGGLTVGVTPADITLTSEDIASTAIELIVDTTPLERAETSSLNEAAYPTNITVTARVNNGAPAADVTVTLSVDSASTALSGTDYADPGTLADITIPANETQGSATISIDPTEDYVEEDSETIVLKGSTTLNGTIVNDTATLTIVDNDTASTHIDLSTQPSNIYENNGAVDVTVVATLRGKVTRLTNTVVELDSTLGGTANGDTDYTTAGDVPQSVTILAGSLSGSATSTFKIEPTNDDDHESHEYIWLGGTLERFTVHDAEIILVDNDSVSRSLTLDAVVTADDTSLNENAGTPTTVKLTATLDGAVRSSDTVVRLVLSGTAEAGADYVVAPPLPQIIIPAGQVEGSTMIVIEPLDDSIYEGRESENIIISGTASGGLDVFGPGDLRLEILDDDTKPTGVTLTTDISRVHEAGPNVTMQVTATLQGDVTLSTDETVALQPDNSGRSTAKISAVHPATPDYQLSPDPLGRITIPAGATSGTKTITVLPMQDSLSEGDESFIIIGLSQGFTVESAEITLTDDDRPPTSLSLSVNPSSIIESAGKRSVRVTADLDGSALTSNTTVTLSLSGSADRDTDYQVLGTLDQITIPADETRGSATVDITLNNDTVDEGVSETIVISGTAKYGNNSSLTVNGATLTIVDDDTVSDVIKLTVGDGKSVLEIVEDASTAITVTATRGGDVTSAFNETVQLRLRGTAVSDDFTVSPDVISVVIDAEELWGEATWTITTVGDNNSEGTETIEIEGAAAGRLVQGVTIAVKDAEVNVPERAELGDPTPVNSFRLNWNAPDSNNNNETQPSGYRLQRRELGGLWHNVADISEAETYSHVDRGPFEYSTTYQWRLVAYVVDDQTNIRYDGVPSEFVEATTAGRPVASISNEDEPIRECTADPSQGTVILANGWSPADISTAAALAARIPGTIVLYANAARLPNHVRELLCSYQPSRIIVVGGTAALSNAVVNRAQDTVEGAQIDRLNGATRIHTAAAAARSTLGNPAQTAQRTVFIANGWSAPDLGAAAAAAGRTANSAVLFTASDSLPEATRDVITDYLPSRIVIVGGTAAVSAAVAEAIAAANPAADVQRLEGATRVDTAAAAARLVLDTPGSTSTPHTLIVANGWSPPDIGVAAAYAAGTSNSAVVFTEPDALPAAVRRLIADYQPSRIVFIGGIATIPRNVSDAVAAAAPNARIERISGATRTHTAAAAAQRVLGYAVP